jgi:hypothetical protein
VGNACAAAAGVTMPGTVPNPTPILRFLHIDNLPVVLQRGSLHAPNWCPKDGLAYKTIHNLDIQNQRKVQPSPCGPRGVIHDYVAFYFGYLSPMMLQLKTGRVAFLVHRQCEWSLVKEIVVIDDTTKARVDVILARYPTDVSRSVRVQRDWYYW